MPTGEQAFRDLEADTPEYLDDDFEVDVKEIERPERLGLLYMKPSQK